MKFQIPIVFAFAFLIFSCQQQPADEKSTMNKIEKLETLIYSDNLGESAESGDLQELSSLYVTYATNYAGDEAPEYLFKAAEVEKSLTNFDQAVAHFDAIITGYPEHSKTPMALFYKGFIFENDLEDLNEANKCYTKFAETYPEHELIESVRFSIANLGRPIDEIIYEFDKKNEPKKPRATPKILPKAEEM